MYSILHEILKDRRGGMVFTCFGPWHLGWLVLTLILMTVLIHRLQGRGAEERSRTARNLIDLAFGLYIADLFLMPLAYGEIDIEKLPFHACTAMCVLCWCSHRSRSLENYRVSLALLGFLSNLVYLIYPAGVMWHQVGPLSYRVLQTLGFHALMSLYGLTVLLCAGRGDLGNWRRHLTVLIAMTAWALLGNWVYNSPDRFYNWFFVVRDPFYILPEHIAPFVMPVLNIALFFTVELGVCAVFKEVHLCDTKT